MEFDKQSLTNQLQKKHPSLPEYMEKNEQIIEELLGDSKQAFFSFSLSIN
jgi:predicted metal-binding transcription factor (methanogenesis marker protein 9)